MKPTQPDAVPLLSPLQAQATYFINTKLQEPWHELEVSRAITLPEALPDPVMRRVVNSYYNAGWSVSTKNTNNIIIFDRP